MKQLLRTPAESNARLISATLDFHRIISALAGWLDEGGRMPTPLSLMPDSETQTFKQAILAALEETRYHKPKGQNQMSNYYELQPAYGRDYRNAKEAIQAFLDGQDWEGDFQMGFKPCGIADFKPGDTVNLRYGKLRKVAVYQIKNPVV